MTQTHSLRPSIWPIVFALVAACGTEAPQAPRTEMVTPEPAASSLADGGPGTASADPARAASEPGAAAPTAPAPSSTPATDEATFGVVTATFTHGVESRQPVDEARTFVVGERATLHLVVKNLGAPRDVTVEWLRGETVVGRMFLPVGTSPSWRTWATRRVGTRDVELGVHARVVDADGNVLHEAQAPVRAPAEPAA